MISQKITDKFMSVVGLFENTLWKYSNNIAYNQKKEQAKRVLSDVYWYKDIFDFVQPELDKEWVDKFLRTVFTYHENPNNQIDIKK